jgi:hypothetical protein
MVPDSSPGPFEPDPILPRPMRPHRSHSSPPRASGGGALESPVLIEPVTVSITAKLALARS